MVSTQILVHRWGPEQGLIGAVSQSLVSSVAQATTQGRRKLVLKKFSCWFSEFNMLTCLRQLPSRIKQLSLETFSLFGNQLNFVLVLLSMSWSL